MKASILITIFLILSFLNSKSAAQNEPCLTSEGKSRVFDPRTFQEGGDSLLRRQDADVYRATFKRIRLENLFANQPTASFVAITVEQQTVWFETRLNFKMTLYDNADNLLDSKWANFPCPDDCVPPDPFLPTENTFDVADIKGVLEYNGCKFVNIHFAERKFEGVPFSTFSAYPLIADDDYVEPNNQNMKWQHSYTSTCYFSVNK